MNGNHSRINCERDKTFDYALMEAASRKPNTKLSGFMTRPAYAGTSLEQKDMFSANKCMRCAHWKKSEFFEGCTIKDISLCPRRYE